MGRAQRTRTAVASTVLTRHRTLSVPTPLRGLPRPWLRHWISDNGPYLYHVTNTRPESATQILTAGIIPWDEGPGALNGARQTRPRPGHVYLSTLKATAALRGSDVGFWLPRTFAVDIRDLNPELFNPDEDAFWKPVLAATSLWSESTGLPNPNESVYLEETYGSFGAWAAANDLGSESMHTQLSLSENGTVAYEGAIPPAAVFAITGSENLLAQMVAVAAEA